MRRLIPRGSGYQCRRGVRTGGRDRGKPNKRRRCWTTGISSPTNTGDWQRFNDPQPHLVGVLRRAWLVIVAVADKHPLPRSIEFDLDAGETASQRVFGLFGDGIMALGPRMGGFRLNTVVGQNGGAQQSSAGLDAGCDRSLNLTLDFGDPLLKLADPALL